MGSWRARVTFLQRTQAVAKGDRSAQLRHDGADDEEESSPTGTHSRFFLGAGAVRSDRRPSMLAVRCTEECSEL